LGQIFQKHQIEHKDILLSTAYFPAVAYMSCFALAEKVTIEKHENYHKQSFRNRMELLSANGKLSLNVPVKHNQGNVLNIVEARINFSEKWQMQHIRAIQSAYSQAPYYEFFAEDYLHIIKNAPEHLFELNMTILKKLIEDFDVRNKPLFSDSYVNEKKGVIDLRNIIEPKTAYSFDYLSPYQQVFSEKFSFISNLSALDLLFNVGSESWLFLE
jgi:hypothetical protein